MRRLFSLLVVVLAITGWSGVGILLSRSVLPAQAPDGDVAARAVAYVTARVEAEADPRRLGLLDELVTGRLGDDLLAKKATPPAAIEGLRLKAAPTAAVLARFGDTALVEVSYSLDSLVGVEAVTEHYAMRLRDGAWRASELWRISAPASSPSPAAWPAS